MMLHDLTWAFAWLAIASAGVAGAVFLSRLGVASTYVRDMLHVGAGVWVLGWPAWSHVALPSAITAAAAIGLALAPRIRLVDRFRASVSGGDEGWAGLVWYTMSFVALTAIGLTGPSFPAAAGLLALTFGDGLGGAVGRNLGRRRYQWPWAKPKTLEGSITVAAGACLGVLAAAALTGATIAPAVVLGLGAIAAIAEGLAPRATDNILVPAAVWAAASLAI